MTQVDRRSNLIYVKTSKIDLELKRLVEEKNDLVRKLEIIGSNIALLHKVSGNGNEDQSPPTLGVAALAAMQGLKRFTRTELADRIKHLYPGMEFNHASVVKPIKQAIEKAQVRVAQASQGNKRQSIYEWVMEE